MNPRAHRKISWHSCLSLPMPPKLASGLKTATSKAAQSLKRTASKLSTKSSEIIKKRVRSRSSWASAADASSDNSSSASSRSRSPYQATVEEIPDEDAPARSSSEDVIDVDMLEEEEWTQARANLGKYAAL